MGMNKKEQALIMDLQNNLALAKAFRWTTPVEKDLPPPAPFAEPKLTKGYDFNLYSKAVEPCCSSSVSHGYGQHDDTTSQNARSIFSTRLLALRALRHAMELDFAAELVRIDRQIEAEQSKVKP